MVTTVTAVTALLVMAKVAAVAPAATVTETGTVAAAMLLLVSVTTAPPAGAAAASVTVPVEAAPLVTVGGLSTTDEIVGFTTSVTVFAAPLYVAVMVTAVTVVTALVVRPAGPSFPWHVTIATPVAKWPMRSRYSVASIPGS